VPGCGKTHLGLAIANAGLDRMGEVRWWFAPELVEEARRLRGPNPDVEPEQYFELKRGLREAGLLVLDDFGGINPSDFAIRDFLAPILDARYRDRRPTVFTLVAPLEDIRARISDAIGRRMQDPDVCQVVFNAAEQWKAKSR
jgi:DNA replication protein DnaC